MSTPIKPTAYSYIRFSSPEQAKGNSRDRQTERADTFARENGLTLDTELTFADLGMSSWNNKNATEGELSAFLEAVQTGQIKPGSYLLVEAVDRLSRAGPVDAIPLLMQITNAGILVALLAKDRVVSRESLKQNPFTFFELLSETILANQESSQKSDRVGRAWKNKRKLATESGKPMTKRCPAWLTLKADRSEYEVIPEREELIIRIFVMSALGMGKYLIMTILNAERVDTWGDGIHKSRKSKGWHSSYIQKILTGKAVLGIYQPHRRHPITKKRIPDGEPLENYFPAIVSAGLWKIAQKEEGAPRGPRSKRIANLFSGIIHDGYNAAPMRFVDKSSAKQKGSDWRYLVSDIQRISPGSKGQNWPYTLFETWMLNHLKNLNWKTVEGASVDHEILRLRQTEAEVDAQCAKLRASMDRLLDSFLDAPDALKKAVQDKANRAAVELETAENDLKTIQSEILRAESTQSHLADGYESLRDLIANGDFLSRIKLQSEIRKRIASIHLFRHGHPTLPIKWPTAVIVYANGNPHLTTVKGVFERNGPHTSQVQVRDSKTGAFRKLKPGDPPKQPKPAEIPSAEKNQGGKISYPAPAGKLLTREEIQQRVKDLLPPWDPEVLPKEVVESSTMSGDEFDEIVTAIVEGS